MAKNRAFREAIYREYMEFFERAEKNRRWSVFTDIPWDDLDASNNDEDAALCAETFVGVESYLPDYVSQGINVVRDMFGRAWFSANWGYEESKHALALREYLVRSGQRTAAQMFDYEEEILGKQWKLPFETARQMTFYGAVQELATFMMYKHQEKLARDRGDEVLATIYGFVGRDEAAHADFYRKVTQLEIVEDREGAIRDMAIVFKNFRMPGANLVPDYDARTEVMRKTGGVDRGVFFKEVWFPTLKKVGVTREDITRASAALRKPAA
ncbi:MAG: acyl-ACP desaturase [Deltaproteobacteria bacterium]